MPRGKLEIKTTRDEDDLDFIQKKAILVINIQKLINGKSVFGINRNINIGSIIIDDVHACLAAIEIQYTILIPASDSVYESLIKIFSDSMKSQSENKFVDIVVNQDPYESMLIPFWDWQNKYLEVYGLVSENSDKDYMKFSFPKYEYNFRRTAHTL